VILPEFVPRKLWQHLLHNQHALLIKGALLFKPNVVVPHDRRAHDVRRRANCVCLGAFVLAAAGCGTPLDVASGDAHGCGRDCRPTCAGLLEGHGAGPSPELGAAAANLDRFIAINAELVALSRQNSDVRSLALSLGHKRTLTAACDDSLRVLQTALQRHPFTATR
jgi:hypothetical protein